MKSIGRIKKFLIVGISAAFVNVSIMVLFVEGFGFKTYLLKNLANILSIEISIIYNYMLSRAWTWSDTPAKKGRDLLGQCVSFHVANLTGLFLRVVLFAFLEKLAVFYVLNIILGIVLAAFVSYILYDKIVFKRPINEKPL
jgi:dolichol-phosphate mannosyltransferase